MQAAATRARAALLLREQRDEVKRMNQMTLYAKCAAERDAQVRKNVVQECTW
jgi:Trichohyalin-plectin-homology domain